MSMRDFVDGECGQNPVLQVASHFTRDSLAQDLGHSSSRHLRQDVSLLPPTTFQMDGLLREIHAMSSEGKSNLQVQVAPPVTDIVSHAEWTEEFFNNKRLVQDTGTGIESQHAWTQEYMAKDPDFDPVWEHSAINGNVMLNGSIPPTAIHPFVQPPLVTESVSAKELLDESKWLTEYSDRGVEADQLEKTELMITAEEFLKSVSDPKIKATEFMKFVEKLSTGDIGEDGRSADSRSQQWASEFENETLRSQQNASNVEESWSAEYVTEHSSSPSQRVNANEEKADNFWESLNEQWDRLAQEDHPWLSQTSPAKFDEPYKFAEDNAFSDFENPFEEGKRRLAAGDIPSAVLLFEASVQKTPDNPEAWMYLGTTQGLNEQDLLSISALNKCLELEPNNLPALMSLATSLTNESFNLQACNVLKRWLKLNEKYAHLVNEDVGSSLPQTTSLLPPDELNTVQTMFINAARLNPSEGIDADVQCGLGILFNLASDYDKAADCFEAAVTVRPEDPLLWNRLGATLANGGKSSEAIAAYRRALELSAGYIRTRYNLGIACVNLGAYREAADHFLTALNMQANADVPKGSSSQKVPAMSDSIWASLRTSLHLAELGHLTTHINARNLDALNREFGYTTS